MYSGKRIQEPQRQGEVTACWAESHLPKEQPNGGMGEALLPR